MGNSYILLLLVIVCCIAVGLGHGRKKHLKGEIERVNKKLLLDTKALVDHKLHGKLGGFMRLFPGKHRGWHKHGKKRPTKVKAEQVADCGNGTKAQVIVVEESGDSETIEEETIIVGSVNDTGSIVIIKNETASLFESESTGNLTTLTNTSSTIDEIDISGSGMIIGNETIEFSQANKTENATTVIVKETVKVNVTVQVNPNLLPTKAPTTPPRL